jgi:hypothetical protein
MKLQGLVWAYRLFGGACLLGVLDFDRMCQVSSVADKVEKYPKTARRVDNWYETGLGVLFVRRTYFKDGGVLGAAWSRGRADDHLPVRAKKSRLRGGAGDGSHIRQRHAPSHHPHFEALFRSTPFSAPAR